MSSEPTVRESIDVSASLEEAEYFSFPLSPGQTAMLPRELSGTSDTCFNGAFRMNIAGRIDAALLQRAFREIATRHEVLRTIFTDDDGESQQIVLPGSNLTVETIDLRGLNEDEKTAEYDTLCAREARTGFVLTAAPPIRVKLLRMEDERSVLTVTVHQIICDGWSIGLIMEELADLYSSLAKNQSSSLLPPDFQYADYVLWQQEEILRPEVQTQLEYWRERLTGVQETVVPPDNAVGSAQHDSAIVSALLPQELSDSLHAIARAHHTTFFVVTLAACVVLLRRYTGREQLVVRTPLAGRTRAEFEGLVGQFLNQILICSNLPEDPTFSEVLAVVREAVWEAIANQGAPFERVMEQFADAKPDAGKDPFRINFICQREYGRNGPFQFQLGEAEMTTLPSKSQGALFDLNFFLVERSAGWRLSLEYRTGLYTPRTAENLHEHFQEILRQIATDPTLRISQVALSKNQASIEHETAYLPAESSGSRSEEAPQATDRQVMQASFAQARFWTLSQLDPASPMLHVPVLLRLTGDLSVPRLKESFRLLISRHETLRTTFTDIDGELMQIIHDGAPFTMRHVTMDGGETERASRLEEIVSREIGTPFDLSLLPLFRVVLCRLAPDDHVLILTMHHVLTDAWSVKILLQEIWTAYDGLQGDDAFQFAPLAVQYGDFAVWQREAAGSEWMREHLDYWLKNLSGELPVLNFPLDHASTHLPSGGGLETLLLPNDLTQSLKRLAQAEDTTFFVVTLACFAMLLARASNADDVVIGSPVANRRVETEPLIGPFAGPIALRLHLQGDLTLRDVVSMARETTLGALQHADLPFEMILEKLRLRPVAGRNPLFQFYFICQTAFLQAQKLAGLSVAPFPSRSSGSPFEMQLAIIERDEGARLELEYNAALFEKESCREWLHYYQTLLAAMVSTPGLRVAELQDPPRVHAAVSSTNHGVPDARFIPTGKPGPDWGDDLPEGNRQPSGPATTEEEVRLARIWSDVLGVQSITRSSNFFELGGHSLLLIRLFSRINKEFRSALPITAIFDSPTLSGLAKLLSERARISSLVRVQSSGTRPPLFMVHSYLLYRALSDALGNDQPFYGLRELPEDGSYSIKERAVRYVAEMRSIQQHGPYYVAGWCAAGPLAVEVARQLVLEGEKVRLLALFDSWLPGYAKEIKATRDRRSPSRALWDKITNYHAKLHTLSFPERFRNLWTVAKRGSAEARDEFYIRHWRKMLNLSAKLNLSLPQFMHNTTLQTYAAMQEFHAEKTPLRITLIRASETRRIPGATISCGWERVASRGVEVRWAPGDHETMFRTPNLEVTAKVVSEALALAEAQEDSAGSETSTDLHLLTPLTAPR